MRALLDEIDPAGREIERFGLHSVTLDDVFLALTSNTPTPNAPTTPEASAHV